MLDKTLDGFGELFRMLSYEQIGSAAMLSRAAPASIGAPRCSHCPAPNTPSASRSTKLILPEIGHVVRELERDDDDAAYPRDDPARRGARLC